MHNQSLAKTALQSKKKKVKLHSSFKVRRKKKNFFQMSLYLHSRFMKNSDSSATVAFENFSTNNRVIFIM